MGMSVNTNIASMNAYRNLSTTNDAMSKSLERLSSGFRINKASDDAAGLAISEGLRSQIGGMTQAVRNTQDGTSVVQTAEGALNETTSILQRMRDLSVQAANDGGLNTDAKESIQKEMGQLKSELSRISSTTQFNGTKLLDGSYKGTFQVGANAGETISVNISQSASADGLDVDGVDVTTAPTGATTATTVNAVAGTAGTVTTSSTAPTTVADYKKLSGTISVQGKSFDLASIDFSGAADATAAQALLKSSVEGALGTGNITVSGGGGSAVVFTGATPAADASASAVASASPTFAGATGASDAIKKIDLAIKNVSSQRADLGAIQNRFEHTINNLNVAIENTTASESRIRDTDMASEMSSFTRSQVLTQAGTSMLAQANQSTQSILKLLG